MQIEFVNHSSLIVREDNVSLMCDFWKDGSIFDNGWDLLCPTQFEYEDFANISHIWFSHEHPDHFSPQNLSSIPAEIRQNITILFQETIDKRLISFCRKLGFGEIIELEHFVPFNLTDNFQVTCAPYGADWADVDSWLYVKTSTATFLNINDCEIENDRRMLKIKEYCGKIDLLATQFSYASKQGDESTTEWIKASQTYHLKKLDLKLDAFDAVYTLPFASFVYWSHQENKYLNQGVIPVGKAVKRIEQSQSLPIVMYPDDKWTVGCKWENSTSLQKYAKQYDAIQSKPDTAFGSSEFVTKDELMDQATKFIVKMTESTSKRQISQYIGQKHSFIRNSKRKSRAVNRFFATFSGLFEKCERCKIFVRDHNQAYEFTILNGLVPVPLRKEECHISINSHALKFGFSVGFGGETLQINGRFQLIQEDGWLYLSEIFFLARRLEQKLTLPKHVALDSLAKSFGLMRQTND